MLNLIAVIAQGLRSNPDKEKSIIAIMSDVNYRIARSEWYDLDEELANLKLSTLNTSQILAYFRSSFPVRSKLPGYTTSLERARLHLGPSKEHLFKGLIVQEKPKSVITIWMEGYRITGNESDAQILGEGKGRTLAEAIVDWKENNPKDAAQYLRQQDDGSFRYWGCRLFDNEKDARGSFG